MFSKTEKYILSGLALGVILSWLAANAAQAGQGQLEIYFLDVGQGDAIFIQAPNGNQVLIDGGPDNRIVEKLSGLMPFYDRSIDLMVLTHPHADRLSGLLAVLERYRVGRVLENRYSGGEAGYIAWQTAVAETKTPVWQASAGQSIDLGLGAELEVLYPFTENSGQPVNNPNNVSLVLRLDYENQSVLFTGDIEKTVELKLVALSPRLDADFLKVAHHGSKTSSTGEFLDKVTPIAVFISVGADNRYGHPSPEVLDRLEKRGIKYYRTDKDGTLKLLFDGAGQQIISKN